ncbi:MAG: hypothetical protein MJ152_03435, partial [Clostridia bacterium]|nr:hypothetical protein [Clostridia bacterium]
MKIKSKSFKRIFTCFATCLFFVLSSVGLFRMSNSSHSVYATSENISISNSNFKSSTTKSAPSDFEFVNATHNT